MNTPNIPLTLNCDALPISASMNDILIKYTSALAEIQRLLAEVERLRSDRDCEKRIRKDAEEFRENAIARAERYRLATLKLDAELATERARGEKTRTALKDAISTYFGADKLVTAERIEAWQAALKEDAKSP